MNELISALRRFIMRDLTYLIGGGSLVASVLYTLDRLPKPGADLTLYLLIAGISYVVGYALQDSFGLLHIVPTTAPRALNPYCQSLYRCYVREAWTDIPVGMSFQRAEERLSDERQMAWLERITSLQQVGTTVGPCWLTSSVFLGARWWLKGGDGFGLVLPLCGGLMGLILVHLAWIKAAQQAQYLSRHAGQAVSNREDR